MEQTPGTPEMFNKLPDNVIQAGIDSKASLARHAQDFKNEGNKSLYI